MSSGEVVLRNSERKLFKECQWKWEREYVDRLKPRRGESDALWFGTGIHLAMEKYYVPGTERGVDPRETWETYVLESDAGVRYVDTKDATGSFEESVEVLELGKDMLTGYLEKYGGDPWLEVIATEFDFQVRLPYDRFDPYDWQVDYVVDNQAYSIVVGSIDLVYRDTRTGKIWLRDYKTAARLGSANTQFLPMDDQAGLYLALGEKTLKHAGLLKEDEKVEGIVYDYLVKSKSDTRPKNAEGLATNKPTKAHYVKALGSEHSKLKVAELEALAEEQGKAVLGDVSKQQPPKRFDRVEVRRSSRRSIKQIERVQDDLTSMDLVRYGYVDATKTTGTHCSYCPFLEICQLDEEGRDWQDLAGDMYKTWDPYETHREELSK